MLHRSLILYIFLQLLGKNWNQNRICKSSLQTSQKKIKNKTADRGCNIHLNLADWSVALSGGAEVSCHHQNQTRFQTEPCERSYWGQNIRKQYNNTAKIFPLKLIYLKQILIYYIYLYTITPLKKYIFFAHKKLNDNFLGNFFKYLIFKIMYMRSVENTVQSYLILHGAGCFKDSTQRVY